MNRRENQNSWMRPKYYELYNQSKAHVESQNNIPKVIRKAIIKVETELRLNRGNTGETALIDYGLQLKVPNGYEGEHLYRHLWRSLLEAGGKTIYHSIARDDGSLTVNFMHRHAGYVAKASVLHASENVSIGDWQISKMMNDRQESSCIIGIPLGHQWSVVGRMSRDDSLSLNCKHCGADGSVDDLSSEEWDKGYTAHFTPYSWSDITRVTYFGDEPFYVGNRAGPSDPSLIKPSKNCLTLPELVELKALEELVIKDNLWLSDFNSMFQHATIQKLAATEQLVDQMETIFSGRKFCPATVSIIIREFIRESLKDGSDTSGD